MEADPFVFHNYEVTPKRNIVRNKGTGIKMRLEFDEEEDKPYVRNSRHTSQVLQKSKTTYLQLTGGGLQDKFLFYHLHFHWGSNDDEGSEHTIDGVLIDVIIKEILFGYYDLLLK